MRGRIFIDFATILSCIARRKNYLLSSHVWRQDHNGFSHQDPGFLDHVINKKAEVVRVYLPPDANTLLSVTDHCSGLIHRLTYRRTNHHNFHVHGFRGEGTTTTSFDMVVLNHLDRFHLFEAVFRHLPQLADRREWAREFLRDKLAAHRLYIEEYGVDLPEICHWQWN